MKKKVAVKNDNKVTRRNFITSAAAGTAYILASPAGIMIAGNTFQEEQWPAGSTGFRFHMIAQAHIDPVWLWPWSEGVAVVLSTFRSALDRMNENPEFAFTASSAQFYQWVAENDPSMLSEIKKRVEEGRWNVVGGWWVEPDVNIPSGEAMVRQGLYGQLTLQRLLGKRATVAFNPDSFGHTGTLPQIIKKQGMENYIFMRPGPLEKTIPADIFWWESPDGTRTLTYRIQSSYVDNGSVKNRIKQIMSLGKNQPVRSFMAYYGAGDHGGGATKENIRSIEELKLDKNGPKVFYSTPDKYFREIRGDSNLKLPVVKDDLQHHSPGCYTAESGIKKDNRQAENALVAAEKISALGSVAWGAKYPLADFTSAWQRVLFMQFHDSLAGTSLPEHYTESAQAYGYALEIARNVSSLSLQKLEWQIASEDPSSQYLVVFNPHGREVSGNVEYDFSWDTTAGTVVEDDLGKSLLYQWAMGTAETGNRRKLIVNVSVPPFGYRQIRIRHEKKDQPANQLLVAERRLENEFLRVDFSPSGTIGIYDKENRVTLFSGDQTGCRAVVINDPSDTWSHDVKSFSDEIGSFGNATFKILETGPLRGTIRVETTYGSSRLSIDWSLYAGSSKLEASVTLDWHEHLKMLKFSFPVEIESPVATYETPYGFIVREANGNEDPGQRWIDLTGKIKGMTYGFTVINDAKYGYSIAGKDMRVSVARSAVYAHHRPRQLDMEAAHIWMDQGIQTFRMLLVPHEDTWQKNFVTAVAEEFMSPILAIYQGIHGGKMSKSGSFLSIDDQNIIISAVKVSETGNDLIIRCVESAGSPTTTELDFKYIGKKTNLAFRSCEIKTLRVNQKTGEIKEVNLLEE
jgi:alpha-mannosidase